jgi:CRISPR-associated protein Csd1
MLLSALRGYAVEHKAIPDFHSVQPVRYALNLSADGKLLSFTPLGEGSRGVKLPIPDATRTSAITPLPLDRGDYTLGIPPIKKTPAEQVRAEERTAKAHAAYVDLIGEAANDTGLDALRTLHRFVSTVDPAILPLPEDFDPMGFVAVYVDGELLARNPAVTEWWIARRARENTTGGVCAVCGQACSPVETVPVLIRGLDRIGGQAKMALISANSEAFERHGLSRAAGASICLDCGNSTHQALNQLIADSRHSLPLGNALYVWWSTEPVDDSLLEACLWGDGREDVAATLRSLLSGKLTPRADSSRFYAVSLGTNSGRVVVRSLTDITLTSAFANLGHWFRRTAVVTRDGSPPRRFGLSTLLAAVAPPGSGSPLSRLDPGLPVAAMTAALSGTSLPASLLAHTLGRLRAEQGRFRAASAALLKACITPPRHPNPEDYMTKLDPAAVDPAYQCGRLLALLDDAARLATTRKNALVDRSYSAASTMPAITFTRLLRLHRSHLDKLRRDKPGAAHQIDAAVGGVLAMVDDLPRTLTPAQQARFALGLYHQQAASRAMARQARQTRVEDDIDDHAKALAEIHPHEEDSKE